MLYIVPDYYKEFQCLADACEDTCCAGWQIVIDQQSLKQYSGIKGEFGRRLQNSIDWKESVFYQSKDKRCAFLNEDNLCDMQLALGEKSLCRTCRRYPRHIEEFENVREITLSLSCPEVARILLSKEEPVKLLSFEKEGEEEFEDFDPFLYSELTEARAVICGILQQRDLQLEVRVGLALGIAHDMQVRLNRGELFTCEEVYRKYQKKSAADYVKNKISDKREDKEGYYHWARHLFGKLFKLEVLYEDWDVQLKEAEYLLYGSGSYVYHKRQHAFAEWCSDHMPNLDIMLEQILVYFTVTYFCGGVYDGKVYAKMRMAADSVFYIYEMLKARFIKNEGMLDTEEVMMLVYRYSRELEHSDENLNRMEKFHVYRTGEKPL